MEKIKTITSTIPSHFDEKVNNFVANTDIVITKHQVDSVSEGKHVKHVAYFHYLTVEEYKQYIDIKRKQEENQLKQKTTKTKTNRKKASPANKPAEKPELITNKE